VKQPSSNPDTTRAIRYRIDDLSNQCALREQMAEGLQALLDAAADNETRDSHTILQGLSAYMRDAAAQWRQMGDEIAALSDGVPVEQRAVGDGKGA
jgi:hypothetical protein